MSFAAPISGSNRTFVWQENAGSTAAATLVLTFNKTETSSLNGHYKVGDLQLELDSKINNSTLRNFINSYLVQVELKKVDQTYEDGSMDSGYAIPSNATTFVIAHIGGLIDGTRLVTVFRAVLASEYKTQYQSGKVAGVPIKFVAVTTPVPLMLGADKLWAAASDVLATVIDDITIATDEVGTDTFLTAA
jgi:hypothetical protein